MKSMLIVLAAVGGLMTAGLVHANADLAKAKGCLNCHAVDQKKVGPSLKDISAKYKGQADAQAKLVGALKEGKGHPKANATDEELNTLVKWVLSQ